MGNYFHIDWVLTKKIAIGPAPIGDKAFFYLKKEGIKSILTLCNEDEFQYTNELIDNFICKRFVLPDHKKGKIPNIEELKKTLGLLKKLQENPPTFVHCYAAMERSPLVCIGWLVQELGYTKEVALDYLMDVHPGTSPLPKQLELINQLDHRNNLKK